MQYIAADLADVRRVDEEKVIGPQRRETLGCHLLYRFADDLHTILILLSEQFHQPRRIRVDEGHPGASTEEAVVRLQHQGRRKSGTDLDDPLGPEAAENAKQDQAVRLVKECIVTVVAMIWRCVLWPVEVCRQGGELAQETELLGF